VQRGTAVRAKSLGIPLGGKTGTTNESRDTWFMGFTPDLVVGLYVGYDQPRSLGKKETGSTVALPGFIEFVSHAMEGKPSRPFAMPKGIKLYKIDMYTGQPAYPGAGGVILEAFKASEEPGMDNYGIAGQGQGLYGGYDYYTNEQQMGQGALPWQSNPQPDTGPEYTTGSGAGYPPPTRYQGYRAGSQAHISVNPAPPGGVSAPAPVATPEPVDNGWQVSPVQQRQPRMRFRGPEAAEQSGSGQSGTGGLY
jgi:membrane peptidoglycan carboxypeptidase